MGNVSNFVSTKEELPEIGQLVWLYDSEHNVIVLGTREWRDRSLYSYKQYFF